MSDTLVWIKTHQKKLYLLGVGGLLVFLTTGPYKDLPAVVAVEYVLKGVAVMLGMAA